MKYAIALALVAGVTSVSASPYFVGENLTPKNHISLGFNDTPTKENTAAGRTDTGNLIGLELAAAYNVTPNTPVKLGLPFYFANDKATGGSSRNALGNVSLGAGWNNSFTSQDQVWKYGYALNADVYVPTSRKAEAGVLLSTNPTTDWFQYATKTTSFVPTLGAFVARDMMSAKVNAGVGYSYIAGSGVSDRSRLNIPVQAAASWHAMPNLNVNVEYNTVLFDSTTAQADAGKRFRHGISPSLSGNYENILASAYATIPLDETTRDNTNVSFGLNAGYTF